MNENVFYIKNTSNEIKYKKIYMYINIYKATTLPFFPWTTSKGKDYIQRKIHAVTCGNKGKKGDFSIAYYHNFRPYGLHKNT